MKIEVIITVWDEGVFKSRDRIESNNTWGIRGEFIAVMEAIENKLEEAKKRKYTIDEDDDIPF